MIPALIGAASALAIVGALAVGAMLGYRRGVTAGRIDAVRRLIRARDAECHVGAHYLEADLLAEMQTEPLVRKAHK